MLYCTDPQEKRLVKAADVLDAYIKCVEEAKSGNAEFAQAGAATLAKLHRPRLSGSGIFLREIFAGL